MCSSWVCVIWSVRNATRLLRLTAFLGGRALVMVSFANFALLSLMF